MKDDYERHGITCHERLPLYPGPADIMKHKILSQGMPWEQEIKRDTYFQFELDSNTTIPRKDKVETSSPNQISDCNRTKQK